MDLNIKSTIEEIETRLTHAYRAAGLPAARRLVSESLGLIRGLDPILKKKDLHVSDGSPKSLGGEVCPETWGDQKKGGLFFEHVYKEVPCSRKPLEELVEILIFSETCEEGKSLFDRIRKIYPKVPVMGAIKKPENVITVCSMITANFQLVSAKDEAATWVKMAKSGETKYILIGRNMADFTMHSDIDRLLRVINALSADVVGGSVRLEPEGRWFAGCYQMSLRNFSIKIHPGHDLSAMSCAYCDYIASPFLIRRDLLIRSLNESKLEGLATFVDLFLRLSFHYRQLGFNQPPRVLSCVDVLFHVAGHATTRGYGVAETHRDHWTALVKTWSVNRMLLPGGLVHRWSCEEVGIECGHYRRGGVLMPGCCLEILGKCVKGFISLATEYNVSAGIDSGGVVGAIKMPGGILPWERDADLFWEAEKYAVVNKNVRGLLTSKYGCRLGEASFSKHFTEDDAFCGTKTYNSCIYLPVYAGGWIIQLWGGAILASRRLHGLSSQTTVWVDGMWLPTHLNPGRFARHHYGDNILGHIQHWSDYGATTSWGRYTNRENFQMLPCPEGYPIHSCLDGNYLPIGNIQFQDEVL